MIKEQKQFNSEKSFQHKILEQLDIQIKKEKESRHRAYTLFIETNWNLFIEMNLKLFTYLNVKCKNVKLEGNKEENRDDLGFGDDFWFTIPSAHTTTYKLDNQWGITV